MEQPQFAVLFLSLLFASSAWGGQIYNHMTGKYDFCITIQETDGSPANTGCLPVNVSNTTLTDNTSSFTLDTSGTATTGWTDDGTSVSLTTNTDNVVLGSDTAGGKLMIDGDTDEIQLQVQGNATQTALPLVVENSAGTDVFTVSNAGAVIASSDLTVNGDTAIGSGTEDSVTANADAWTFASDTAVTLSGGLNGLNIDSNTLSVDGAGNRVGIVTASPDSALEVVETGSAQPRGMTTTQYSTDNAAGVLGLRKARGTEGSPTAVANGDFLGNQRYWGHDGTGFIDAGMIAVQADSTVGTNDMPSRMAFYTTADGASASTERLRIDNAGNVYMGSIVSSGHRLSVAVDTNSTTMTSTALPLNLRNDGQTANNFTGVNFQTEDTNSTVVAGGRIAVQFTDHTAGSLDSDFIFAPLAASVVTERMRIMSTGNVGIGDTSPASPLTVGDGDDFQVSSTGAVSTNSTITSSRTTDVGWAVVNAANQACNTTCTNACVVGIDTAALGNFLACTDAAADSCLCAGSS